MIINGRRGSFDQFVATSRYLKTPVDNKNEDGPESEEPFEDEDNNIQSSFSITRMKTISHAVPHIDLLRLPAAKFQRPAHISRSAFLTQLPQPPPSPSQEGLPLDADMDDTSNFTDTNTFGVGSGTSEISRSTSPATQTISKRVRRLLRPPASEASSGAKRARLDNVTSDSSHNSAPPKEKKTPQFAVGYVNRGKPKAADYEDVVQALLLRAIHEYESRIVGVSPYPDSANQSKWAKICWKEACCVASENYGMTERMSKMIKSRGSRIRGELVRIIRSEVASCYGFNSDTSRTKVVRENRKLYDTLIFDSTFTYKNVDDREGYAQNRIFSILIQEAWFSNGLKSKGIVFEKYFNPISLETLALLFTMVKFCIEEWSNGIREQAKLSEEVNSATFEAFLKDLRAWNALAPDVILKIRSKMYKKARLAAKVDLVTPMKNHVAGAVEDKLRKELEGRTGETDSEDEEEDEEDT